MWNNFTNTIDNSFFFVLDKIFDIQRYFIGVARQIGYVVLLIAILTTALNYALTGTGLKENIIKILKATLFFFIVVACYPKIISWISSYSFSLAENSVYKSVSSYFNEIVAKAEYDYVARMTSEMNKAGSHSFSEKTFEYIKRDNEIKRDHEGLFSGLKNSKRGTLSPAGALKVVFFLAGECFEYADEKEKEKAKLINLPSGQDFARVLKGLVCAFFLIFTGVFAILEYCICFLELALVSSVGVILFPMSLWEGSKFLAEKFIGAIVGFFLKLLFCSIAIYLFLYGFISLFYTFHVDGFQGTVDQIVFIAFTSVMFYFLCKSAPMLAQSLLTGTPNLSGAGAIAAVAGAVGAAASVGSFALGTAKKTGRAVAGGAVSMAGDIGEANAAAGVANSNGYSAVGAWFRSMGSSAGDRLTRSLLGVGNNRDDFSKYDKIGDYFSERKNDSASRASSIYYTGFTKTPISSPPSSPSSPPSSSPAGGSSSSP